jgi:tellurite resistance protein TerC
MPLAGSGDPLSWGVFTAVVLGMLALDLGVFHKDSHEVSVKEALAWSLVWVALSLAFGAGLWWRQGSGPGLEFLTAYLVEKSLSVDNIFVFVMVFAAFGIPAVRQHRVLFWGVLGALALRAVFIAAGAALLARFHWMLYLFGALLALTGLKMLFLKAEAGDPAQSPAVRLARRFLPATDKLHGDSFVVTEGGRRVATPLAMSLAAIEGADVVFAVDSIPAVFAVTLDPFIVYTSNVFAILGLRSMYFVLAGVVDKFVHLKTGLAFVLLFVGAKMLSMDFLKVPPLVSLGVISAILSLSVLPTLLSGASASDAKPS